jgi:methyl-accepting chemotaxis protein
MLTVRRFQYKYAIFLTYFSVIMSVIIGGITLYLLNHNYNLLIRTELVAAPQIVNNIYHELKLANEFIVGAYIGFIIFMAVVGIKFSHSIVVPIFLIQEKMRSVCRGEMFEAQVRIRHTDQFQEFAETYNYMIESLKAQLKADIERLKQIKPNEQNRDAIHIWQTLISEKEAQLSDPTTYASTSPPAQAPSWHRVS